MLDVVNLDSLRIQLIGESRLVLQDVQGELDPITADAGKGKDEEPLEYLSQIIKKVNEVYGMSLKEEDKVNLDFMFQSISRNESLDKVFKGNNTEDAKKEEFSRVVKDEIVDYHGDRLDFYKMMTDKRVFPIIVESLYHQYVRGRVG